MRETLDMIPTEFFHRKLPDDWPEEPVLYLLDAEYADTDVINLNLIGQENEYQIQFCISKFFELVEARGIPLPTLGGSK